MQGTEDLTNAVRAKALPLSGAAGDYDALIRFVGEARFVLLGEASHGTHQFYRERALITQRLIAEKRFTAVAVEADWPDAYRVNRYVRAASADKSAVEALADFQRFPTWMWRNRDVVQFLDWLRAHNDALAEPAPKTGFYGMDLYSLHSSMEAVLRFLQSVDPEAARQARERYSCFDHFGKDTQVYGFLTGLGVQKSCEEQALQQLLDLQRRASQYVGRSPRVTAEDVFHAEQNARLVKNAEAYYRAMFTRDTSSWNLRDSHMEETLENLAAHLERQGAPAKIVVWAHNSHLGDARATEMGDRGELNVGQLVRQRHGREAVLVGFTTHRGGVTASRNWDGPAERLFVRPALPESYEALLHSTKLARFFLGLREHDVATEALREPRLERAIGVVYRPSTERPSHYFHARLPDQFDAVLHFDETRSVEPLERTALWEKGEEKQELPETYPFGV